ncbi:TetR family transcriptional regulator [Paenibacillus sp. FSL R7-0273]|uniref:TetR/AcrR family transcriptional regulator n=1 Tax=Paenibacillus sp. FSL R7-0273 TaxID=1536772 RepID=UPI0004F7D097|nr:TetR/AcrR family transcriptional regulator [Paenibacillus sp. FSL R7-0273]AIQ48572.1 TetR family transcriptional regulator [Paenibacillus sp. FSL R7-0273]OMF87573.1 TetR family transcriptional regulator [Paenibacillus sp. FSL R7-0273]
MSAKEVTEFQRLEGLRLSNEESNRITRSSIEAALVLLMNDQAFEDITITAIVKRAGVSRTAYYRNYNSKEDILQSTMKEIADKIVAAMNLHHPIRNSYEYWLALFQTLEQHLECLQIILKVNMADTILNDMQAVQLNRSNEETLLTHYAAYFWSGAIYSVAANWIRGGGRQSAAEMATICYRIIEAVNGN